MKLLVLANNKQIAFKKLKPVPAFSLKNFISSIARKIFILLLTAGSLAAAAQTSEPGDEYRKTVEQRAAKIVNTLEISDSDKFHKVVDIIADQYEALHILQNQGLEKQGNIKAQIHADQQPEELKKLEEKKMTEVKQLHEKFIALLKSTISEEQLEKVKDGMTYRVFPITYAGYLDMLPNLTAEQKQKIFDWLKEARELAMDGESSDRKHAIFGKYKGRINNYLSAAGYDMKKESMEWQKRIKEREEQKKRSQ